eukprot:TRINITY_DN2299_c0_g1_i9.p1 TRINITY_DN2299_c0_g1~~TRINITY_DN2299_c0_g1_i9.p1  ORF type:complete len:211 (+),score=74.02 TRINITY_DN2299_c0_g1_i9:2-634(+)
MATRVDRKEYRRVRDESVKDTKPAAAENEIRVVANHGQRHYITYAISLLTGTEEKKKFDTIKISAMGGAIFNAVNIAEIVKRRVEGVHQITDIATEIVSDKYESIESKKPLEVERKVATILVTLSTKALDTKHVGYQAPLPITDVVEQEDRPRPTGSGRGRGGRGRGSGRGGRVSDRAEKAREGRYSAREARGPTRGRGSGRGSARGGRD